MPLAVIALTAVASPAPASTSRLPVVRPTQQLARLLGAHVVRASPGGAVTRSGTLEAWRPITGGPTVLPVVGHAAVHGVQWLRVRIPGRPNGATAWIVRRGTVLSATRWHLVVRTASRRVLVFRAGRLDRTFAAVVGKPSTPTPHGEFFVEESVRMLPGSAGAPFALATSARSNVLQEFEGGPGQIALHGLGGLGGIPGTAVSHGCVRLDDRDIGWLSAHIQPGVPVSIKS
jgi:lipoprotein-anchoring transpeptidase ErfK/SrfK